MTTFVVMAPPDFETLAGDPRQTDKLQFVPDRFSPLAFVFSIVWMLVHRLWLVLLGYLAITLVIEIVALSINEAAMAVAALAISLLFGFEAQALRRWSLGRKGWRTLGVVDAVNRDEAEIRFFHGEARKLDPVYQSVEKKTQRAAREPIVPRIGSERVVGLTLGPETRQ
ncbi:DUF2628 domain-containing protein [Roseibium denhamense]|uniref:DUF2628 domain-containing protein n=1 Tax=Roseibium denhamense TaxID=76305 RepID=A0ABY1PBR8_9HYPH|nr:DUF2628 domain-containing protein [Roseibium denhamense]MTI05236.1 DUF2628 domain-containing protein [Roseibium denhamense]SMP30734.1 Protein of unknown function [Roseibium denhamense]